MENKDFLNFPNNETCYFSALEEFQQNETYDHLNENSIESEHYYTPLRLENIPNRAYITIDRTGVIEISTDDNKCLSNAIDNYLKNSNKETDIIKQKIDISDDKGFFENNIILKSSQIKSSAMPARSKKVNRNKKIGKLKAEDIYKILSDIAEELKISFLERINSRSKHINLDQTIEDSLEECQYEEVVNSIILTFMLNKSNGARQTLPNQLSQYEINLINFAFDLILNNNVDYLGKILTEFNEKIEKRFKDRNYTVTVLSNLFRCFLMLDLNGVARYLLLLYSNDRMSVLRNLLYFAAKFVLLAISRCFLNAFEFQKSSNSILNLIMSFINNFMETRIDFD